MKTQNELRAEFTNIIKGKNFITPDIISFTEINNGIAELSKGEFIGIACYGVTIVKDNKHDVDLCKPFENESEAIDYINTLK